MRAKLVFAPEGFQEAGPRYTILPITWSFVFCCFGGKGIESLVAWQSYILQDRGTNLKQLVVSEQGKSD